MRAALASITPEQRTERSSAIVRAISNSDEFKGARCVMSFLAMAQEPDLSALHSRTLADSKRLCLPRMDWEARVMLPVAVARLDFKTEVRRHGVVEPVGGEEVNPSDLDLVLVPGLAFDRRGGRLGRGGGFYDRFLESLRRVADSREIGRAAHVFGVCFAAQIVHETPVLPHDARVDAIACEDGLIDCRG